MQLPAFMTALRPLKRSDAKTLDYLTRHVGFVMTPVTKNVNSLVVLIRANLAPFSFSYRQQIHPFIICDLITGNWRQSQLTLGEQRGRLVASSSQSRHTQDKQPLTLLSTPACNSEVPINLICMFLGYRRTQDRITSVAW